MSNKNLELFLEAYVENKEGVVEISDGPKPSGYWKSWKNIREKLEEIIKEIKHFPSQKELGKLGFFQYEISNFSQRGFESIHNLSYWSWKNYIGVGISASSFVHTKPYGARWKNTNSIHEYIRAIDENKLPRTIEALDRTTALEDYLLSVLRKNKGMSLTYFKETFAEDFFVTFPKVHELIENNFLIVENDILHFTTKGLMIFDTIIERLM